MTSIATWQLNSLVHTSLLPIFGQSLLPSIKYELKILVRKKSLQVYTLQDANLGRTSRNHPQTPPLKNALLNLVTIKAR